MPFRQIESHRRTQMHTDSDPVRVMPSDSDVQVDSPWSDLRPGGARPVDEGNAADQSGQSANAVLICRIAYPPRRAAAGRERRIVRVIPYLSVAV